MENRGWKVSPIRYLKAAGTPMEVEEFLTECIEALRAGGCASIDRTDYLKYIAKAVASDGTPEDLRELLSSVAVLFQRDRPFRLDAKVDEFDAEVDELATAIQTRITNPTTRFVYHGTIYGRLADISKNGLLPGKIPVWDKNVPKHFLNASVFFTTTWRNAMWWAEVAHCHSKGRKDGLHRTPAIIRLMATGLTLEPDPLANRTGCLMVRGSVPVQVEGAHVILGKVRGVPRWRPLSEALSSAS